MSCMDSGQPRQIQVSIVSDPAQIAQVRHAVEDFARECGMRDQACDDIGLCVNEALANIVRHAYEGDTTRPVHVVASYSRKTLTLEIRDWGNGTVPNSNCDKAIDPLQPGGIGLVCLKTLMDEVTFAPQDDGMLLTMIRRKE